MLRIEEQLSLLELQNDLPSMDSLMSILQHCRVEKNPAYASSVNLHIHKNGLESHKVLGNHLVPVLVESGLGFTAKQVFHKLVQRSEHSWTSLVQGHIESGDIQGALTLFQRMQADSVHPSQFTIQALLQACTKLNFVDIGQKLHVDVVNEGFEKDPFVCTPLVGMYAKCGLFGEAHAVMDELPYQDAVMWTTLLAEYVEHGLAEEALKCLADMRLQGIFIDGVTYVCSLKACAKIGAMHNGQELHNEITKRGFEKDLYIGNTLVDMYAKCGSLAEARHVFDELPSRDVVSWNALIASYIDHGLEDEALETWQWMKMDGVSPNAVTFISSLQCCSMTGTTDGVLGVHCEIVKHGFQRDQHVVNSVVDAYAQCGSLAEAQDVYDDLPVKNVVAWTALIAGFVRNGLSEKALDCFNAMQVQDYALLDAASFVCILKACGSMGALDEGKKAHALIAKEGCEKDSVVSNALIDMYMKCGSLEDAQDAFDDLLVKSVVSWNIILAGYAERGLTKEALYLFGKMIESGLSPDAATYICILKCCGSICAKGWGQGFHAEIAIEGLETKLGIASSLIDMYVKCGLLLEAHQVLDDLPVRNVVCWTALISGYTEHGLAKEALECFDKMQLEGVGSNIITHLCVLKACGMSGNLQKVHATYAEVVKEELERDPFIVNSLVNVYAKIGSVLEAQCVFDSSTVQDVVLWNALITGYMEQGRNEEVLSCLKQMQFESVPFNDITYVCGLKVGGRLGYLGWVQEMHTKIVKEGFAQEEFVANALVDAYARAGLFAEAERLHNDLAVQTVVSWNALITGYCQHGQFGRAMDCFDQMLLKGIFPDSCTFICSLGICSTMRAIAKGQEIHMQIIKEGFDVDPLVVNALVNLYLKCGYIVEARDIFDEQPAKETGLWNTLISGHVEHGLSELALDLLSEMEVEGTYANAVTRICILKACGSAGALGRGQDLHGDIVKDGFEQEELVGNALVGMYAKCGSLSDAHMIFDELLVHDVVSWTALISGYACQGEAAVVLKLLESMKHEGIQPDGITFLNVLSVCSHAGLIKQGWTYFETLCQSYGFAKSVEHYNCMLDLMCRAGQLSEAFAMLKRLQLTSKSVAWNTILGACQKWGDVDLGKQIFNFVLLHIDEIDPTAAYVLMSNVYANSNFWEGPVNIDSLELENNIKLRKSVKNQYVC